MENGVRRAKNHCGPCYGGCFGVQKSLALGLQRHVGLWKNIVAAPNVAVARAPVIFGGSKNVKYVGYSDVFKTHFNQDSLR